ncbi:MAG: hypothetical protein EWV62_04725 [Microcystis aeruginosa Ma_OC_LR_19540900_S633]|nr:MAG: hypothetical protein EWV62_04725 [Microcystis aeruginosa Ma_OC_LR_19540900_S633]
MIDLCVLCVFVVRSTPSLGGLYLRIHFTHQIQESRGEQCTFWANAVRPYIVDKIRYCRGAKLAPSDQLGYYSHASPLA